MIVVVGGVCFVALRNDRKVVPVPEDAGKCPDLTDNMESRVDQAAVKAATPGAPTGSGKTGTGYVTKVESPTECLGAAPQTHEFLHSAACQALQAAGKVGRFGDYQAAMTMVDYWCENLTAYSAEMQSPSRQIARVKADAACMPKTPPRVAAYSGAASKGDQKDPLAAAQRRVTIHVTRIF